MIPGFRKGRAPSKLIEKRYGHDITKSLKTQIVAQSFFTAAEKNELDVLGDPLFFVNTDKGERLVGFEEALERIEFSRDRDMEYRCEVEVKPKFDLPELAGIPVKAPKLAITDKLVDEQIALYLRQRGRIEPVTEGAAEAGDLLVVRATLRVDGEEVKTEENLQVGVRPTRLDSIPLLDFDKQMIGVNAGETRTIDCTVPDDYERPDLRGKKAQFELVVHEVKRLSPATIESIVESEGFADEADFRKHCADEMEDESERYAFEAQLTQIEQYLLDNTKMDLPEKMSSRASDRAMLRTIIDLQQRGVPMVDIEAKIDELRTSSRSDVERSLRLSFILEKIAKERNIEVSDEQLNSAIAMLARSQNRRFDTVQSDLEKSGQTEALIERLRGDMVLRQLLDQAKIEVITGDEEAAEA
jgi:trigger factor